jgi:Tol biopolymer transport system component
MGRIAFTLIFLTSQIAALGQETITKITTRYLGESEPQLEPKIFSSAVVSLKDRYEFGSTFSADGNEFFYAIEINRKPEILYAKFANNVWTKPVILLSHEKYGYNDPFLSPDGQKLFFISDRALDGKGDKKDIDIWYIERAGSGWSEPVNAGPEINTSKNEYYISFTKNGSIYFSSNGGTSSDNNKNYDIKTSRYRNGNFQPSSKLSDAINTLNYEADVFISPDEKYIIYCSERPEGKGKGDLYISFQDQNGSWLPASNIGEPINTPGYEFCPFVTNDNKFLFFSRDGEIYWVSTKAIKGF